MTNPAPRDGGYTSSQIASGITAMESENPQIARYKYLTHGLVEELLPEAMREKFVVEQHLRSGNIPYEVQYLAGGTEVPIDGKALVKLWKQFQVSYNKSFAGTQGFKPLNEYGYADPNSIAAAERVDKLCRDKYVDKSVDWILAQDRVNNAAHPLSSGEWKADEIRDGLRYMFTRGQEADGYIDGMILGLLPDGKRDTFLHGRLPDALSTLASGKTGPGQITNDDRIRLWQQFQVSYNQNFSHDPNFVHLNEYGYADGATQNAAWFVKDHYLKRLQERDAPGLLSPAVRHALNGLGDMLSYAGRAPEAPLTVEHVKTALTGSGIGNGAEASHDNLRPGRATPHAGIVPIVRGYS